MPKCLIKRAVCVSRASRQSNMQQVGYLDVGYSVGYSGVLSATSGDSLASMAASFWRIYITSNRAAEPQRTTRGFGEDDDDDGSVR